METRNTMKFLFILTLIQFWWIAIWGIAYIVIDMIAGPSKIIETIIYVCMLVFTMLVIHNNPNMVERL
jgi:hypothetical protein